MNIDINKILDQAKESYDRYFKDAPKLPENHGQDVVFDKEKMKEIINEKVNQLEGHVNNLNTLKKVNLQGFLITHSLKIKKNILRQLLTRCLKIMKKKEKELMI